MPPPANPGPTPDCVPSAPTPVAVSVIDYEFPLNERTRTLLRLEDLYDKLIWFVAKDHPLEHHTALVTLFIGIGILMSIHRNRMLVQK